MVVAVALLFVWGRIRSHVTKLHVAVADRSVVPVGGDSSLTRVVLLDGGTDAAIESLHIECNAHSATSQKRVRSRRCVSTNDRFARVERNLHQDRPRRELKRRCGPMQKAAPNQVSDAGRHCSRLLADKQAAEEVDKESGDWKANVNSPGLRQQYPKLAAHAELQREVVDQSVAAGENDISKSGCCVPVNKASPQNASHQRQDAQTVTPRGIDKSVPPCHTANDDACPYGNSPGKIEACRSCRGCGEGPFSIV